jgi:hypothetical protein
VRWIHLESGTNTKNWVSRRLQEYGAKRMKQIFKRKRRNTGTK